MTPINPIRTVRRLAAASAVMAAAVFCQSATAQETSTLPRPDSSAGAILLGPSYSGHRYHSSTWQEGVLHGYSDLLRSSGQRQLLHDEALRSREEAMEHHLDNAVRRLEVRQHRELMGWHHRETMRRLRGVRRSAQARKSEPVNAAEKAESRAAHRFHLAKCLMEQGRTAAARKWFQDIVRVYDGTAAAVDAEVLLASL